MEERAPAPVTAALLKLEGYGLQDSGHFAYGLAYLERPGALALNPLHLPLTIKDALPDVWGLRVLAHELGRRLPGEREQLWLTNVNRVGAMVFSEIPEMPLPAELPHDDLAQLAGPARRLQYDMEILKSLRRLLLRGGSLGSARPKASFAHEHPL